MGDLIDGLREVEIVGEVEAKIFVTIRDRERLVVESERGSKRSAFICKHHDSAF